MNFFMELLELSQQINNLGNLPNVKKPCPDCPFRKDAQQGWLGEKRMAEILGYDAFVCHKKTSHQCAGHMLLNGEKNQFVQIAQIFKIPLNLSGRELIFNNKMECIKHHAEK